MSDKELHCCENCRHFNRPSGFCNLRKEKIVSGNGTTCDSRNMFFHDVPKGVMKAVTHKVKDGERICREIPYYHGIRPDIIQSETGEELRVSVIRDDGRKMDFPSVEDYINYYKKQFDLPVILTGALAGDIIGSVYEFNNIRTTDFPLFTNLSTYTDDTVMTLAVANKILRNSTYTVEMQRLGRRYPGTSYGSRFREWLFSEDPRPYFSYGNGSAMRVSPVAYAFENIEDVISEAGMCAEVTHNHPEGIKGARAVASAVFLARKGSSKKEIKDFIINRFNYDLNRKTDDIRKVYQFDESCQGSVPEAIICFLESSDFENAIRLAVSIGGDSDTIASVTGAIAEAFYKDIGSEIKRRVLEYLPDDLLSILLEFSGVYKNN